MVVSKVSVDSFRETCESYHIQFTESEVKELIAGLRIRLQDIASNCALEEQINVVYVCSQKREHS